MPLFNKKQEQHISSILIGDEPAPMMLDNLLEKDQLEPIESPFDKVVFRVYQHTNGDARYLVTFGLEKKAPLAVVKIGSPAEEYRPLSLEISVGDVHAFAESQVTSGNIVLVSQPPQEVLDMAKTFLKDGVTELESLTQKVNKL